MHPGQELRVVGPDRASAHGIQTGHAGVQRTDARPLSASHPATAKGRSHDVVAGALEPAPWVRCKIGALRHYGHGEGVQGLQQQGPEASY